VTDESAGGDQDNYIILIIISILSHVHQSQGHGSLLRLKKLSLREKTVPISRNNPGFQRNPGLNRYQMSVTSSQLLFAPAAENSKDTDHRDKVNVRVRIVRNGKSASADIRLHAD
jgi:hypothetical protein